MAEPSIVFECGQCGRLESLPLDTLQLIGVKSWLNANGWRVRRVGPHTTRCDACWTPPLLAPEEDVEVVRVRPRTEG